MKSFISALLILVCVCGTAFADQLQEVTAEKEVFSQGFVQVVGISRSGQEQYDAIRAASVVAQRRMLEYVGKLRLAGESVISRGATVGDTITSRIEGQLGGLMNCGEDYNEAKGYARVCLRMNVHGDNSIASAAYPVITQNLGALNLPQATPFKPAPAPAPAPTVYDGVIIDVRTQVEFRPALVNRILTEKKEVLFEPSKVANTYLIERGCGGYTADLAKAKALLGSWGSSAPLVVTVSSVTNRTDVVIASAEAEKIFQSDQKSNILAQARVVYLLK